MTALREQRQRVIKEELRPQKDIKLNKSSGDWSRALETFIAAGDCEMTGCTALQPEWIFDHEATDLPNIVMLGFQHDFEELKHVPEIRGAKDVTRQYVRAAACANKVTNFIRETGYRAEPVTGPMTGKVAMIPPAIACGFGELGKHGSIINPEFGSAFRLSAVLTDAPIPFTEQREFGIDDVALVAGSAKTPVRRRRYRPISSWFGVQKSGTSILTNASRILLKPLAALSVSLSAPGPCRVSASLWQRRCGGALREKTSAKHNQAQRAAFVTQGSGGESAIL